MLRKLRRLRVPVCFYTCCFLCAILLFVSFNEDVKSILVQQDNGHPASANPHHHGHSPPSSSFSSPNSLPRVFGESRHIGGHILISVSRAGVPVAPQQQQQKHQKPVSVSKSKLQIKPKSVPLPEADNDDTGNGDEGNDVDAIKQYINENFVGLRHLVDVDGGLFQPPGTVTPTSRPEPEHTSSTTVISNLVRLAQQASNNPHLFQNINRLTGATGDNTNNINNNELSQHLNNNLDVAGTTTSDTELLYPGNDSNSPLKKGDRKWFMTGGDYFPTPPGGLASIFYPSPGPWGYLSPKGTPTSAPEYRKLWYDKTDGSDRVIEQLMFAIDDPINYANISWGWEGMGLGGTTVRPSSPGLTAEDEKDNNDNNAMENSVVPSKQAYHSYSNRKGRLLEGEVEVSGSGGGGGAISTSMRDPRLGKIKTILLFYGLGMSWGSHVSNGRQLFLQQRCPVNACRLTGNRAQLSKADIVVFKDVFMHPKVRRPPGQLWAMYMLECPLNTQNFLEKNAFNLTATYRHDSDIVTPYEKWVYFDDSVRSLPQAVNYAEGKTKKVAWFVSNCVAKNNRLEYAKELAKYIEVDIYGACGSHTCSRANAKQCFEMLSKNYKFYLAFENSNCRDYISEKFFVNGLGNNVLPIVMGAHPDDYKRVSPDRSYIHVDDFSSPKELAQYLHELDTNDDLYNEYFKWKGTGEFVNTHFFCRLCAMAHYATRIPKKPSYYKDFNKWWRGPHVCTRQSWRSTPDIFAPENYDSLLSYH